METAELCARAAYEADRHWCRARGGFAGAPWEEASEWERMAAIDMAKLALSGAAPATVHDAWRNWMVSGGWKPGPKRDPMRKLHPGMVAYEELAPAEQRRDVLFVAICQAVAGVADAPAE